MKVDVAIIGAGLAGLSAARQLSINGYEVAVFEADNRVGGRVQSDLHESGAILDRGFQLYNPAYPESARVLDHKALDLRPFGAAVISCTPHGNIKLADPRKEPRWVPASASPSSGSVRAKLAFIKYALTQRRSTAQVISSRPDQSAHDSLMSAGVTGTLYEEVIRPFLAGVFLEPELYTSSRFLNLVLKSFMTGTPSLPSRGMQAIPDQLAASLPAGVIRLNSQVTAATRDSVTVNGTTCNARAVIVATDSTTAHTLCDVNIPSWNAVTTWYHLAPHTSLTEGKPVLIVNGGGAGPLNRTSIINSVALTNAVPEYAPGHTLISTSALGLHPREQDLSEALQAFYGVKTTGWELIGHYPIAQALPAMTPPHAVRKPAKVDGVYLAGDYRSTSSIQGAMVSGRQAAEAAIGSLRGRVNAS